MQSVSSWVNSAPKHGSVGERWAQARAMFRQPPPNSWIWHTPALARDRMVVIPDFLQRSEFTDVLAEFWCSRWRENHPRIRQFQAGGCANWSYTITPEDPAFSITNRFFRDNDSIRQMVQFIAKRRVDYWPSTISILDQSLVWGASFADDANTHPHQDVRYPTAKVVLYLTDVTPADAPFRFWVKDTPTPILGPANTLIVADHSCFHARGPFAAGGRRVTLRMSFRYLESPRYRHRWLFDRIRPINGRGN